MNLLRKELLFNVLFWSLYFGYEWLGNAAIACQYDRYLINAAVIVPLTFLAGIFTIHVLIKKLYLNNRKKLFWAALLVSAIAFTLARRSFNYFYTYPLYYPEAMNTSFWFLPKLVIEGVNIYLIVALYAMFYFIKAWYEQQRITQALQQEKLQSELELLKAQVHPHFIFNTLNNIYSLSVQKSSKTPDLIYRLSAFLDYNLYHTKQTTIPVSQELEYINNYIELEKIRIGNRLDVAVNVYDPLDRFSISPLLLLPVVENCFKHGINSSTGSAWLRIDVTAKKDWLTVKIENSHACNNDHVNGKNGKGIGLKNVCRRLEIVYPGKHEFSYMCDKQSFLVVIKIKSYLHEDKVPVG